MSQIVKANRTTVVTDLPDELGGTGPRGDEQLGLIRETALTLTARGIALLTSLGVAIVTARLLGPDGRGVYAIAATLVFFCIIVGDAGLGTGATFFTARRRQEPNVILASAALYAMLAALLLIGIGYLLYRLFSIPFAGLSAPALWLALAALPFLLFNRFADSVLLGLGKIQAVNGLEVLQRFLILVILSLFLFLVPTVEMAFLAMLVSISLAFLARIAYLHLRTSVLLKTGRVDLGVLGQCVKFGMKERWGFMFQQLNYRLDLYLVNWLVGPTAVGIYTIAVVLAESLWHLSQSAGYVLLPKFSAMEASEAKAKGRHVASASSRLSLLITASLGLGLAMVGPWLIPLLFGEAFAEAKSALLLLLPGIVAFSMVNVVTNYLVGRGYPQLPSLAFFCAFVVTVTLDLILIPGWGIRGAALASSVSYISATALVAFFYRKIAKAPFREFSLPRMSDFQALLMKVNLLRSKARIERT